MKPETIKQTIQELEKDLQDARSKVEILEKAIEAHRSMCPHQYDDGSSAWVEEVGINYRYEVCRICGKEINLR